MEQNELAIAETTARICENLEARAPKLERARRLGEARNFGRAQKARRVSELA